MRILLLTNYYYPEEVGAGIWIRQLATDLRGRGHQVTVITSFPSYPDGVVFPSYKGRAYQIEIVDGIRVIRTYTYATKLKTFLPRFLSFGAFCASCLLGGLGDAVRGKRADVVYAILPPLPLGLSGWVIAKLLGARLITNIQDIYPDVAVETQFLTNSHAIRLFRKLESWTYRHSSRIVVISEGFRRNLLAKGVPAAKLSVVPNWADTVSIQPLSRETQFRTALGSGERFVVLYSGSLSLNSCLEPVIEAAALLPESDFQFVFVGGGARKEALQNRARALGLQHVVFLPFQPLEMYGEVLASADATLVTLNNAATFASVPSKIFKQMAAARPIVAVTNSGNELERLIEASNAGVIVGPDDPDQLVVALRSLRDHSAQTIQMGLNGRSYVEQHCSRDWCVDQIEGVCARADLS